MRIIFLFFLLSISKLLYCQLPTNDLNWNSTLVLNDYFTGITRSWGDNRLDNTNKWKAYFSESGVTHGPYEHQIYQRENAIFSTTSPGMTLRAEYKPNTTNYWYPPLPYAPVTGPFDYISGAIEATSTFKYGYFEIKCSLPAPNFGNFPAFWLYSGINRYNEIDVFEHVIQGGADDPRTFTGTYYTSSGVRCQRSKYTVPSNQAGLTSPHTYAIEWSPKVIIWYFDGKQISSAINEAEITDQPMRLKVNYALDNYVNDARHDTSLFPLDMKINYIKVYNLKCDCTNTITISNSSDLNNFSHAVKKNITISNAIVNVGNTISLRATDGILINNDFEVPIGAEFYAFTHGCPQ